MSECKRPPRRAGVRIPNSDIAVDLWLASVKNRCKWHFLTHCHTDHTTCLTCSFQSSWRAGPIYCSQISANLLQVMIGVDRKWIYPLKANESNQMQGFTVTPLDACHCPGAVMYLFESDNFGTVLCTGDFRCDESMAQLFCGNDAFQRLTQLQIDHIYLDTTYLSVLPYDFPTRQQATDELIAEIRSHEGFDFYIGLNKLGKEDMLLNIAQTLSTYIVVDRDRFKTLSALELPDVWKLHSESQEECCSIYAIRKDTISKVIRQKRTDGANGNRFKSVFFYVSMLPLFNKPAKDWIDNTKEVIWIRYSEHSSHNELIGFLQQLTFGGVSAISGDASEGDVRDLLKCSKMHYEPPVRGPNPQLVGGWPSNVLTVLPASNYPRKTQCAQAVDVSPFKSAKNDDEQLSPVITRRRRGRAIKRAATGVDFETPESEAKKLSNRRNSRSTQGSITPSRKTATGNSPKVNACESVATEMPSFAGKSAKEIIADLIAIGEKLSAEGTVIDGVCGGGNNGHLHKSPSPRDDCSGYGEHWLNISDEFDSPAFAQFSRRKALLEQLTKVIEKHERGIYVKNNLTISASTLAAWKSIRGRRQQLAVAADPPADENALVTLAPTQPPLFDQDTEWSPISPQKYTEAEIARLSAQLDAVMGRLKSGNFSKKNYSVTTSALRTARRLISKNKMLIH